MEAKNGCEPLAKTTSGKKKSKPIDLYWANEKERQKLEEGLKASRDALRHIHDTYYLVNVVDNGFTDTSSDALTLFTDIISERMSKAELQSRLQSLEVENAELRKEVMEMKKQIDEAK